MLSHTYNKDRDLHRMQIFLAELRRQVHQGAYLHFGDLLWRMHYFKNGFDVERDIRIWEDGGTLQGFVFVLEREDNPEFQLRPDLYDSPIADAMFTWAAEIARAQDKATLYTSCIEGDDAKAALLSRHGYTRTDDDVMVFMERDLSESLPKVSLPDDYTLISHNDRPDLPGWTGTPITAEQYAPIWQAPGYLDNLGLRVCYQGREIVAGAVCWYDVFGISGEFEPVGTAEAHRGKGLAFAVMAQELRNLRAHGTNYAYVRTGRDNLPAVHLYQKLGFRITAEDYGWALNLA